MEETTHHTLARSLFNHTWTLIEKTDRSPMDQDEMINAAHASLYHWSVAGTTLHQARGHWQVSRVYAIIHRGEPSLYHAQRCISLCEAHGYGDWDIAFAHEAAARAYVALGDLDAARAHDRRARELADDIEKESDRKYLMSELATLSLDG
ncbi:MAG: hypothetical protein AAFV53_03215 [Myxococcota bacterium]